MLANTFLKYERIQLPFSSDLSSKWYISLVLTCHSGFWLSPHLLQKRVPSPQRNEKFCQYVVLPLIDALSCGVGEDA